MNILALSRDLFSNLSSHVGLSFNQYYNKIKKKSFMESNSVNGNKIKRIEFNLYTMFGYE